MPTTDRLSLSPAAFPAPARPAAATRPDTARVDADRRSHAEAGGDTRPLKVVCVYPTFDPDLNELAIAWNALAQAGLIECRVIAGARDALKGRSSASLTDDRPNLSIRRPADGLGTHGDNAALIRWAAEFRPDVICTSVEVDPGIALRIRRLSGAPIAFNTEHWFVTTGMRRRHYLGIPALRGVGMAVRRWRFERHADGILVMNPRESARLAADPRGLYHHVPWPHPNASDTPPLGRAGRHLGQVAYVGSLSRWKGAERLAAYLDHLLRAEPEACAVVVGPATDDCARQALARLAQWGPHRCRHVPHLPRAQALATLGNALCVLAPSDGMGWGLIGDAWNTGTPIIAASDYYDLDMGRNALPAADADRFLAAYRRLRDDAALWTALADAGRDCVRERHSVEVVARAYYHAVQATVARHRQRA
jgi:glycosyltransferase involved in cell wall biosynthesis